MKKIVIQRIMGPIIGVTYPYRKTPDVYIVLDGQPVHCIQCDADFPAKQLKEHILIHDKRKQTK